MQFGKWQGFVVSPIRQYACHSHRSQSAVLSLGYNWPHTELCCFPSQTIDFHSAPYKLKPTLPSSNARMPPLLSESEYASSEDSDFAPEPEQPVHSPTASDSESKAEPTAVDKTTSGKREPADHNAGVEDAGFENSGDEAVIQKGHKRLKRKKRKDAAPAKAADDEGGEGGLIKTRSMRATEKADRKAAVAAGPVTIDVDAVWRDMMSGTTIAPSSTEQVEKDPEPVLSKEDTAQKQPDTQPEKGKDEEKILIKRKYNFAGKIHTETKLVARSSAEAKLYLSTLGDPSNPDVLDANLEDVDTTPPRRVHKAFRSKFEPSFELLARSDLNLLMASTLRERESRAGKAKKLNTVEKSRMDWAGFVDKEGIKDDLELAGKSKMSYAEREGFLARSEIRREEESRRARVAGRV